uniref:Uncharacterized protein n=1 Tax=Salvator merianae TaxID=96440 RepID=A0A8D0C1G5_SALMN
MNSIMNASQLFLVLFSLLIALPAVEALDTGDAFAGHTSDWHWLLCLPGIICKKTKAGKLDCQISQLLITVFSGERCLSDQIFSHILSFLVTFYCARFFFKLKGNKCGEGFLNDYAGSSRCN